MNQGEGAVVPSFFMGIKVKWLTQRNAQHYGCHVEQNMRSIRNEVSLRGQ